MSLSNDFPLRRITRLIAALIFLAGWLPAQANPIAQASVEAAGPVLPASPGDLDVTFGSAGKVLQTLGYGTETGYALIRQPDGALVVAGSYDNGQDLDMALARYHSDGSLDLTFGANGVVTTKVGLKTREMVNSLALQQDGKILAAGWTGPAEGGNNDFVVARYNPDGSLDAAFGGRGIVTTDLGGGQDSINGVILQGDGKIVAAGSSGGGFAMARYNPDGSLDASFDGDGKLTFSFGGASEMANSLALDGNGLYVLAGSTNLGDGGDFALARVKTDGTLDTAFDGDGKLTTNFFSHADWANSVAVADGKIVAAGSAMTANDEDIALARYNSDGTLDTNFSGDGLATTNFMSSNERAYGIAINPVDGKITALGYTDKSGNGTFALARYQNTGALDTFFNSTGMLVTDFSPTASDSARSGLLEPDGHLVAAGYSNNANNFALARYGASGSLDPTFGSGGKVNTDLGFGNSQILALARQADGKLVAGGWSAGSNGDLDFALARFDLVGALDISFGTYGGNSGTGIVTLNFNGKNDAIHALAVQADGKILAAGYATNQAGNKDFILVRYNANGSLDTSFGVNGKATRDISGSDDEINTLVLLPNGQILAAGSAYQQGQFALARYNANGTADGGFGAGGVTTNLIDGAINYATSMKVQYGKVVLAGVTSKAADANDKDFALARYDANGILDASFGAGGKLSTSFLGTQSDFATALMVQLDGKLIVGGYVQNAGAGRDLALARYSDLGSLDATFGIDGLLTLDAGGDEEVYSLALQGDGKIIAAGSAGYAGRDFTLARIDPSGSLDSTFGGGGWITTDFGGQDQARAVLLQPDGRLVAGGVGRQNLALARYVLNQNDPPQAFDDGVDNTEEWQAKFLGNPLANDLDLDGDALFITNVDASATLGKVTYQTAGRLDAGFDADGLLDLSFGVGSDAAEALLIAPGGKILVGGKTVGDNGNDNFALARLNSNGSLDAAFGFGGKAQTDFGGDDSILSMAWLPGGRLLAVGYVSGGSQSDIALASYTQNGALDSGFGSDGSVITDLGGLEMARAVAVQPDGKILVAGEKTFAGGSDMFLIRYNPDGGRDVDFGEVTITFGAYHAATSLALTSDSKILVAGYAQVGSSFDFTLARLLPDGELDTSFSGDGKLTFGSPTLDDYARSMSVQPDGKIILAGSTGTDFSLARFYPDGAVDLNFGAQGLVTTDFGGADQANAAALQPGGKIILVGSTDAGEPGVKRFALARYAGHGALDLSFGASGKVTSVFGHQDDEAAAAAVQADGQIVAAGFTSVSGNLNFALARYSGMHTIQYDPNGQFDWLRADDLATDFFIYSISDGLQSSTARVTVTIIGLNSPPRVNAGPDQNVSEGSAVQFSGSFTDLDGPPGVLPYRWDFGDDYWTTTALTPTHTYARNGVYTATLTVTDTVKLPGADSLRITVVNVPPSLPVLPDRAGAVSWPFVINTGFSDPGINEPHTATITWEPGQVQTIELAGGQLNITASHSYKQQGTYSVTVTVSDPEGGVSARTFQVIINDRLIFLPLTMR